jgi:hypothetical protein
MVNALGGAAESIGQAKAPIEATAGLAGPLVGVGVATAVLGGVNRVSKKMRKKKWKL